MLGTDRFKHGGVGFLRVCLVFGGWFWGLFWSKAMGKNI